MFFHSTEIYYSVFSLERGLNDRAKESAAQLSGNARGCTQSPNARFHFQDFAFLTADVLEVRTPTRSPQPKRMPEGL